MRNIHEPSTERSVKKQGFGLKNVRQQPGAFRWWTPGCDPDVEDDAEAGCSGDEPLLVNDFAQPSVASGLELFAFRLHRDGSLQFKGHLDVSSGLGATPGAVAVTIPGANSGETDFLSQLPDSNTYPLMVTTTGGVAGVVPAIGHLDKTTGELTVRWTMSDVADHAIEYLWGGPKLNWFISAGNDLADDFSSFTRDTTVDFDGYLHNGGGSNGTEMFIGAPLGPQWSSWALQFCHAKGPDYGILKVQVAVTPVFRRCEGENQSLPGSSLRRYDIPTPQFVGDYDFTWHDLSPSYTIDAYTAAAQSFNHYENGAAYAIRITGPNGALLTDVDTGLCEHSTGPSLDSGDGVMYWFRLFIDGKNASSTGHKFKFQAIRIVRMVSGHTQLI